MRLQKTCYRFLDPRWAFDPTSGDGAAVYGARFNPKGTLALYMSLSVEGALAEIAQGFAEKYQPCVLVSYDVDCDGIVDLRDESVREAEAIAWSDLDCPWKLDLIEDRVPKSWDVARQLIERNVSGILVPSFAAGADPRRHQNLVLWRWGPNRPCKVVAFDPDGRLPRDQRSWR